ncbi:MAG: TolC family protein, partial [Rikenellaceae bacterium]
MKQILTFSLILLCCQCSPKLQPITVQTPDKYRFAPEAATPERGINLGWWQSFDDPTLDELILIALERNQDLEMAANNIEISRMNRATVKAAYLPSLSFEVETEQTRIEQTTTQYYYVEPTISWEISLFGALKNSNRAARAELLAKEWAYRALELSLCSEVATTYFTLREYQSIYAMVSESYSLRRESAQLIDSMFHYGMSDEIALSQARSLEMTARSDMSLYERAILQTCLSLDLLLGGNQLSMIENIQPTRAEHPTQEIPVGLPSSLLERRPDVIESYYALESAAANVGVKHAARFPSISLTGGAGLLSTSLSGLTSGNPLGWDATATLTQPIFSFKKLKRAEEIAIA